MFPSGRRVGDLPGLDARACPCEYRRPTPSVIRCAHHSTRGKPGSPAPLDATPAVGLCFARRNPVSRACRLGARGKPPTATPTVLGRSMPRRRFANLPGMVLRLPPTFTCLVGQACVQGLRLNALPRCAATLPSGPSLPPCFTAWRRACGLRSQSGADSLAADRAGGGCPGGHLWPCRQCCWQVAAIWFAVLQRVNHTSTVLIQTSGRFARSCTRSRWAAALAAPGFVLGLSGACPLGDELRKTAAILPLASTCGMTGNAGNGSES